MFPHKYCQELWDKSPKLVGQMLELVGHLSHQLSGGTFVPPVIQLKYALSLAINPVAMATKFDTK